MSMYFPAARETPSQAWSIARAIALSRPPCRAGLQQIAEVRSRDSVRSAFITSRLPPFTFFTRGPGPFLE
jgi:hypothetical protein